MSVTSGRDGEDIGRGGEEGKSSNLSRANRVGEEDGNWGRLRPLELILDVCG